MIAFDVLNLKSHFLLLYFYLTTYLKGSSHEYGIEIEISLQL